MAQTLSFSSPRAVFVYSNYNKYDKNEPWNEALRCQMEILAVLLRQQTHKRRSGEEEEEILSSGPDKIQIIYILNKTIKICLI